MLWRRPVDAAELALQRTGGSAALVVPPPLQWEAVCAALGLQPYGLPQPGRETGWARGRRVSVALLLVAK